MLNLAGFAFGQREGDNLSFTLPLLHGFVILQGIRFPLLCRHKVWSTGGSPRNTLQFLWELHTEVTCWVGRCFSKPEAQQVKVQDQQMAAKKMVACKSIGT